MQIIPSRTPNGNTITRETARNKALYAEAKAVIDASPTLMGTLRRRGRSLYYLSAVPAQAGKRTLSVREAMNGGAERFVEMLRQAFDCRAIIIEAHVDRHHVLRIHFTLREKGGC